MIQFYKSETEDDISRLLWLILWQPENPVYH